MLAIINFLLMIYAWIGIAVGVIGWGINISHADNAQKCIGEKILMFPLIVLVSVFAWPWVIKAMSDGNSFLS